MKKKSGNRAILPVVVTAGIGLALSFVLPLEQLWAALVCFGVSLAGGLLSAGVFSRAEKTETPVPETAEEKPAEAESAYSPEVQAIIDEGLRAQKEMGRLYASINNNTIRDKINQIMMVSDKIVQDAKHDPSDVPQIQKFLSYYLPTTIKLLNAYDRMGAQGIEGENISGTMKNIEEMLDTAIVAYRRQLDALFANQAMDIDTDIQVMNAMLAREGLADDMKTRPAAAPAPNTGYESPFGSASPLSGKESNAGQRAAKNG